MDSIRSSDVGYVEEDNASCSAALDSVRLSSAVQQILAARRSGEIDPETTGATQQPGGPGWLKGLAGPFQPPLHESTECLREFSEAAGAAVAKQQYRGNAGLEVRTFLDLQAYDLAGVAEKRRNEPGSLQILYMFYSRIYEKLVGKQRGVDVPLFNSIDLSERNLGFRGLLDLTNDFKLCPSRVGRRELERIFATVHPGLDEGDEEDPRKKFESKITYWEFLDLLAYCGDAGEPMDRSKVDGSRARCQEPRLERVKRLGLFMALPSVKKVRLALHNAYRDVHFWKLSDGADFEKEARAAEMRSRPQWRVEPLPLSRRLDREGADAAVCKYLSSFTWLPNEQTWEEYEVPILDMGTSIVGGPAKHFKLTVTNRQLILGRFKLEVVRGCPLRLPWRDAMLGPGQSIDVNLEFVPVECGEWCGAMILSGEWKGGHDSVAIPTYARVLQPQSATAEAATRLPWHAPRPFRPGSARRIIVDPASIAPHQMRPPVPQRSRSSSTRSSLRATPTAAGASGFSGYSSGPGHPPRLPSPGSGLRSSTPMGQTRMRTSSGSGDSAIAGGSSGRSGDERARNVRPHSAPSMSPQKAHPGAYPADPTPNSSHAIAAGGGIAAVRARPRSASIGRHQALSEYVQYK
jgi:hypothetical protein